MRATWRLAGAAAWCACAVLATGALPGCKGEPDGLTQQQKKSGDRLGQIAERTGGDWNKLTEEERGFLIKDLSYGSEQSARMLLAGAARKGPGQAPGRPTR